MNPNYVLKRFLQRFATLLGHLIPISVDYDPMIVDFSLKHTFYGSSFMYNRDFQ